MEDDVIPLNEIGKIETVKVYNQSYVNKQQKRIAELEELLNSTLEENKDIYKKMADLDTALEDCTESLTDARIKIKELEKENEELKERNNKAKELLEDLIKFQPYIDREAFFISLGNEWKTAIYRAEQFLKEITENE